MRTFLVCLLLLGCASLDTARTQNREHLNTLTVGMTRDQVLSIMGTKTIKTHERLQGTGTITNPYRTESYMANGRRIEVVYYYTDLKRADGAITDDELTPIVLVDGKVDGWGWGYWNDLMQRYELRVR